MNDDSVSDLELGETVRGFRAGQEVFARYRLVRMLGRGGMGVVWLAQDETLERQVALKFLPELVTQDRLAVADLKRETNRSLQLTHPHIVRVHDFVEDRPRDLVAISMEYVDGDNLSNLRAEREHRCFEVEELSEHVRSLCEALAYAHQKARIIHRDLKPANLMVTSGGELKVADFGIARSLVDSVSRATGGISGTLVYMSPQQAIGKETTTLDDIYSLGATLYDLLTGKPPFYTGNIVHQLETVIPPPMSERRAELGVRGQLIPSTWEKVVAECLEKDPARRPQNAMDAAWRLGLVKNYEPAMMPIRPSSGRRLRIQLAAVALLLVVSVSVAGWWFGVAQPRPKAERPRQLKEQNEDPRDNAAKDLRAKEEAKKKEDSLNAVAAASKERPYQNSLGMRFVPVPETSVLFSVWATRVKDYKSFVEATKHDWPDAGFKQTEEHPAVNVSWDDATAFCNWLTKKEQTAGLITASQSYRLPTDLEWSAAVGLNSEDGSTPEKRDMKVRDVYPWGTKWPPPSRAGNYDPSLKVDDYKETSPIGSFEANRYGLCDMGGNVWQWCEDWWNAEKKHRVLRGASWSVDLPGALLSSCRSVNAPEVRYGSNGFRCVLVVKPSR